MRIQITRYTEIMMKYYKRIYTGCVLLLLIAAGAQAQITEKAEFGKFAITNATIHTVSDGVIENGVVLINGEKIEFVGKNAKITTEYQRINAEGKHLYPGFMDSGTQLGLQEIGAVEVTNDQAELGAYNPHVRAFTAINPSSASIPVTRVNGVTHVISLPVSGRLSGKATLIDLYGYSPDSMAVSPNAGLHLNWPSAQKGGSWDDRSDEKVQEEYEEDLKELNEFWEKAVFYDKMVSAYEEDPSNKEQPDADKKMEAMREVLSGDVPVVISVDRKQDILNAIEWTQKHPDVRFILAGVKEGWRVADEIAESGLPALVATLYTPERDYDNYQRPYQNPGMLHEAGVKVAIATGEVENVRNAPYHAGYAATYGLGKEEALKAITLNAAEIFGVEDKLGSIEAGKQANLFLSDGDPFEPMSQIEQVFIRGYKIPMVSRHTQLNDEYLDRGAESTN
ncbi:amidohydrolase family protein [Aliifodinibius salicampi]|uniref:Amidohydrolase family protein n=1 Tax=Fodinibius salicampi TaxID=1920655 RepID=A0ABT3PVD2_9BACT|nr:amidohydrolase family protein [Fodinibius salicampi]MCW9711819.1 amidohydrolase family protein [Fodinibius salicampi]